MDTGKKSIFMTVIHLWRSPFRQFALARTIDKYDITMPAPHVRVTSQINCGDVTMLIQKRPSSATMAKSAINNWFSEIVCSGHKISCKKLNNTFVAMNNDFWVTHDVICQWFSLVTSSLVKVIGKSPHSWPKIVIHSNSCIILYYLH